MADRALDPQEQKWQREDDARTLAQAEEIKADAGRKAAAQKEAAVLAKDAQEKAAAMKKVAKDPGTVPPSPGSPGKGSGGGTFGGGNPWGW